MQMFLSDGRAADRYDSLVVANLLSGMIFFSLLNAIFSGARPCCLQCSALLLSWRCCLAA